MQPLQSQLRFQSQDTEAFKKKSSPSSCIPGWRVYIPPVPWQSALRLRKTKRPWVGSAFWGVGPSNWIIRTSRWAAPPDQSTQYQGWIRPWDPLWNGWTHPRDDGTFECMELRGARRRVSPHPLGQGSSCQCHHRRGFHPSLPREGGKDIGSDKINPILIPISRATERRGGKGGGTEGCQGGPGQPSPSLKLLLRTTEWGEKPWIRFPPLLSPLPSHRWKIKPDPKSFSFPKCAGEALP